MCGALAAVREQGVDFKRIASIAFDGSTHNAVLMNGEMKPLRKTIMWTDQRSVEECAWLKRHHAAQIFATAWQMPTPTWTLPQLMWINRHEPEVIRATEHILFVKDYVRYLVTGVSATDYIEAQGTLFYDMQNQKWSQELVALTGLKASALPKLVKPADRVGSVTESAARDTGIPAGTPVICGSSDSAIEDYGAGAVEPGDCIVKLATAGNVNVMTDRAIPHERTLTYSHIIEGMYYTVSATNAAAVCQRWFRDNFCDTEKRLAAELNQKAFNLMDKLAESSPAGSNGVLLPPVSAGRTLALLGSGSARQFHRNRHGKHQGGLCKGASGRSGLLSAGLLRADRRNEASREAPVPHRRRRAQQDLERNRLQHLQSSAHGSLARRRLVRRGASRGNRRRNLQGQPFRSQALPQDRPRTHARSRNGGKIQGAVQNLQSHS